jgi:hypothetical protein
MSPPSFVTCSRARVYVCVCVCVCEELRGGRFGLCVIGVSECRSISCFTASTVQWCGCVSMLKAPHRGACTNP